MADWFFIGGVMLLFYTYAGYPLLMLVLSRIVPRPPARREVTPSVSLIITAYNEEAAIASKLESSLALDYPADKLEIIVASDGSTDRTDDIVAGYAARGVKLNRVEGRRGKTAAQNETVRIARGEILVFSDATTVLEPDSVRILVRGFADPTVGCVGGRLVYVSASADGVGLGGVSYWQYERMLKKWESEVTSLIGVSGCFYAMRKSIYQDIPPELISDFVVALNTYQRGYRVGYEDGAVSYEDTLTAADREFRMRVRVAIRSYAALWEKRELLNPLRHGLYAIQLLSHKLLRYAAPLFLIDVWIANVFLLEHPAFRCLFVAQCGFYSIAVAGHWLNRHLIGRKLAAKPYYFLLANAAALVALVRFVRGERMTVWKPMR